MSTAPSGPSADAGPAPTLLPEPVLAMMDLVAQSDSVELKLTVPASAYRAGARALEIDPLAAQIRQVYFFDTPDLALDRGGVVARARRIQGRDADSTIKLRPVIPDDLPADVRRSPQLTVELDAMPGGYVCSASMRHRVPPDAVLPAVTGKEPVRGLFSKEQRRFFESHAPQGVGFDDLETLGPILVLKQRLEPAGFSRRLVVELWTYPDGARVVELSTKCAPGDAVAVALETRRFLASKGVPLGADQQTKTRTALEFFAAELAAEAESAGAPA